MGKVKVMRSVVSIRPFVSTLDILHTRDSSPGVESQGHRSRVRVIWLAVMETRSV